MCYVFISEELEILFRQVDASERLSNPTLNEISASTCLVERSFGIRNVVIVSMRNGFSIYCSATGEVKPNPWISSSSLYQLALRVSSIITSWPQASRLQEKQQLYTEPKDK
jgi:hypothetical protein